MNKKTVVTVSVISVAFITALILVLSLTGPRVKKKGDHKTQTAMEHLSSSDATPGENLETIEKELSPQTFAGYYVDKNDGWYYQFTYEPTGEYEGTFSGGFDPSYKNDSIDTGEDIKLTGEWKLENGEIKLYSGGSYQDSMWACDGYIVDSKNYFVGDIDLKSETQQSMFVSRAPQSGDTQIINLYSDNNAILEIVKDSGKTDSGQGSPVKEMYAGTYEITDNILLITIGQSTQEYYIVNDGFAKWIYNKV
ncbi:MAG: hypothetical protein E7394_00275 [Ruminococcaceae bacterium]|nr:hypothetical protein [Oscillospiraceae bacterium]